MVYGEGMAEESGSEFEPTFEPAVGPKAPIRSINQLVSYNLMRARRSAAWTQQDVAELLEKYTGRPWSNASVSAAERAWQGGRPRRFDANELVALSVIFDEPIGYFFLPPDGEDASKWVAMCELPDMELPKVDPSESYDLMSVIPSAQLVSLVGMENPPADFVARLRDAARKTMGLVWDPPEWGVVLHEVKSLDELYQPRPAAKDDQGLEAWKWPTGVGRRRVQTSLTDDRGRTLDKPPMTEEEVPQVTREDYERMVESARKRAEEELFSGGGGISDILRRAADLLEANGSGAAPVNRPVRPDDQEEG